ncbi:MAG: class I SAM-dependent methyltransferase [Methanobacterium paludis]|nr:class I SAM-dependent methyltransferase [Methanobacterium paludis]
MIYKEDYDALRSQYNDPSSLMYKKLRVVDSYINGGKTLLDIGTGVGELLDLEKNKFKRIYSFDMDKDSVEFSKNRFQDYHHIKIELGDLDNLENLIKDKKFDYITCLDVLEHVNLNTVTQKLNIIYKLLDDDGVFIFTGPGIFEKIRIKLGRSNHVHSHSSYSWMRMLKNSNFKISSVETVEFPIFNENNFLRKNLHLFGKCCLIVCKK